jgi:arylsulfatase A-like enzyme
MEPAETGTARNVVVVLLDSLNRHMLGCYGADEFDTPNLDRFAARATRFTNHRAGSLPCMPARHDILCGALDFLWRPWGSIELWERPITASLRADGIVTMLVTDHPHLFETGGENYHTDFFGWEYVRGHEGDPWRTAPDPSWMGAPERPARPARPGRWYARASGQWLDAEPVPYDRTRTHFRDEHDYPGPRVMTEAASWLRTDAPHHDRWLLVVDEFDPHEPFDVPPRWLGRYEDRPWTGELIIWPPYADGAVSRGRWSEHEARHVRANYGAKLTMIDHWFGLVLDALDETGRWDDTAVIVTTDHGHYLGDQREGRDLWGKPAVPHYAPMAQLPLLVHWPSRAGGGTTDALTTAVDLHATLADIFGVEPSHRTHGRSLVPVLTGAATGVRPWALGGSFGSWVHVTDGRRVYARGASEANFPLSMWSNRWSTMPLHLPGYDDLPLPDGRARLDRMPGTTVPVIRQPFAPGDLLPYWVNPRCVDRHHCYDRGVDPDETENRAGEAIGRELADLLRTALDEVEAPSEQYDRLGLR